MFESDRNKKVFLIEVHLHQKTEQHNYLHPITINNHSNFTINQDITSNVQYSENGSININSGSNNTIRPIRKCGIEKINYLQAENRKQKEEINRLKRQVDGLFEMLKLIP